MPPDFLGLALEQGVLMYEDREPPPRRPADDDDCCNVPACLWLGWMLARARDVALIIDGVGLYGPGGAGEREREVSRRVRLLDYKHGAGTISCVIVG